VLTVNSATGSVDDGVYNVAINAADVTDDAGAPMSSGQSVNVVVGRQSLTGGIMKRSHARPNSDVRLENADQRRHREQCNNRPGGLRHASVMPVNRTDRFST
jgi:hypothetical protein